MAATSVRVEFTKDTIAQQIDSKHEQAIAAAAEKRERDSDHESRMNEWREKEQKRVLELAKSIKAGNLDDDDLDGFRVDSQPKRLGGRWAKDPDEVYAEAVAAADAERDRASNRLGAMHSPTGLLSMTPAMLRDWFGL